MILGNPTWVVPIKRRGPFKRSRCMHGTRSIDRFRQDLIGKEVYLLGNNKSFDVIVRRALLLMM